MSLFSVHPRVVDETITVSLANETEQNVDAFPYVVTLYDSTDLQVRRAESKHGLIRFDTKGLSNGVYKVQIKQGDKTEQHKVLIKH